jgi:ferredoxin
MAVKKKFPYRSALVACLGDSAQHDGGCAYGCLGCEKCVEACKFGAITLSDRHIAQVDEDKCVACGACVRACPRGLIRLHDCANFIVVKCSNRDKGADAKKVCLVSCIGCGICQRTCTAGAVTVQENLAVIDESVCLACGMCGVKCPRRVLHDTRGILTETV